MRKLTLEGKINIFKTLAISKLVYLSLITNVPQYIFDQVIQIQKDFLWHNSNPKIKNETICLDFKQGGLRNVDVHMKLLVYNYRALKGCMIAVSTSGK